MKTLDEHNRDEVEKQQALTSVMNKAGVACPNCGSEMEYYGETVLPTFPTKRRVVCRNCRHTGYKIN